MTVLDTREVLAGPVVRGPYRPTAARRSHRTSQNRRRPGGAPMRYRGPGVVMSRASHRRRPITPAATVGLALLAALITVWLGVVAQFGGVVGAASSSAPVPDTLSVVQVQAGETLQQVAHRVAPDAPVAHVVDRIRELNELESVSLDAGQTLIAPVG
jgi:LysM domain